jgi:regulator of replication initiation timing
MAMTQTTTTKPHAIERGHHGVRAPANDERSRLQVLVGELLSENQKLRFENEGLRARAEQLKQEAQSTERGLKQATKWAGMMV